LIGPYINIIIIIVIESMWFFISPVIYVLYAMTVSLFSLFFYVAMLIYYYILYIIFIYLSTCIYRLTVSLLLRQLI